MPDKRILFCNSVNIDSVYHGFSVCYIYYILLFFESKKYLFFFSYMAICFKQINHITFYNRYFLLFIRNHLLYNMVSVNWFRPRSYLYSDYSLQALHRYNPVWKHTLLSYIHLRYPRGYLLLL